MNKKEILNNLVQIEKDKSNLPVHCCKITNEKWLNELTEENEILKDIVNNIKEVNEILKDRVKTLEKMLILKGDKITPRFKEYDPLKEIDTEKGRKVAKSIRELK